MFEAGCSRNNVTARQTPDGDIKLSMPKVDNKDQMLGFADLGTMLDDIWGKPLTKAKCDLEEDNDEEEVSSASCTKRQRKSGGSGGGGAAGGPAAKSQFARSSSGNFNSIAASPPTKKSKAVIETMGKKKKNKANKIESHRFIF